MSDRKGVFITFEGPDGCGKTTQAGLLARRLAEDGYDVVRTHEPGGTYIGRSVRKLILDTSSYSMCAMTEFLLYAADRAQDVNEVILPALSGGKIVVAERFTDSSIAYQGQGLGISLDDIGIVNRIATSGLMPDLTILLDIDPAVGVARAAGRDAADRIEMRKIDFHRAVRQAYHALAEADPSRFVTLSVDGRTVDQVHQDVYDVVSTYLNKFKRGV